MKGVAMNRQLIRDAIAEGTLAANDLEQAVDQPYCAEFKRTIDSAAWRFEQAAEKLRELQRGA